MANKKNFYYVLVLTSTGAVFVTGLGEGKTAIWDKNEPPKEFTKIFAEEMAFVLQCNGYNAFMVCNRWELDRQPYLYNRGEFKWIEKEGSEK